jgi:hypothetical protein
MEFIDWLVGWLTSEPFSLLLFKYLGHFFNCPYKAKFIYFNYNKEWNFLYGYITSKWKPDHSPPASCEIGNALVVSKFFHMVSLYGGTQWCSWLRHCTTSQKVVCSIPDGVIGIFHWHNLSGHTQPLKELSTMGNLHSIKLQ